MKKILSVLLALTTLLGATLLLASCGGTNITVKTGGTGGTYYSFTNTVAPMLNEKTGYQFSVMTSGGSVESLNAIYDGNAKMAIVQNDTMVNAYNGLTSNFEGKAVTNVAVLAQVYPEVIQIVCAPNTELKSLADLKGSGLRVSIGAAGSGVEANAIDLFREYGLDVQQDETTKAYSSADISIRNLSVADSAKAMQDGTLDVFFFTSGAPATSITELATTTAGIYLLGIDDTVAEKFIAAHMIDNKYAVYAKQTIDHGQYTFIAEGAPIKTIGVTATYVVDAAMDEETAYNITKALWESKTEMVAVYPLAVNMDMAQAFATIGNVPVHKGAAKYYAECGYTAENVTK